MSSDEAVVPVMAAPIKVKKLKRSREAAPAVEEEAAPSTAEPTSAESTSETPVESTSTLPSTTTADPTEDGEPEVPALSHKEKRLAKRRKLAGLEDVAAAVSSSTNTTTSGVIGTVIGNTPSKSAHGIWVGNMNFATTPKMLLGWMEEKGGLKDVTRINMPGGKRPGESNRGFAYLDFPSQVEVLIAVGLSEQHLDGRRLLIKSSTDFAGRPASTALPLASLDPSSLTTPIINNNPGSTNIADGPNQTLNKTARKILDRQKNPEGPTLFLGNLGFETNVEEIRSMFDAHQKQAGAWAPRVKIVKGEKEGDKPRMELEEDDAVEAEAEEKDEDREEDGSDSENESEVEGGDGENSDEEQKPITQVKRVKGEKGPKDLSKANDAGIRKIRLGTFEDTGKCKGWAFVDFHLPIQATRALLNMRNHSLNGRNLVIEYGSAEAVRRGGIGTRAAISAAVASGRGGGRPGARGGKAGPLVGGERHPGSGRGGMARGKGREWDDGDVLESVRRDYTEDASEDYREKKISPYARGDSEVSARGGRGGARGGRGGDRGGRGGARGGREEGGRAKPGAALAGAARASTAIVESVGKKITF